MDWLAYRDEFPLLSEKTYLNSCSLCALSERVRAAVEEHMEAWEARGASAWYDTWLDVLDETRGLVADVLGAREDEIALAPNVSTALNAVASGIDTSQRDRVAVTELDFPTLARPWQARPGVRLDVVDSDDGIQVAPEAIEAQLGPDTAALATSQVFYATGARQDVDRLCRAAEDAGALSIVDAYQATGQIPTDVDEMGCDVLITGGLKWLLAGTGIAYLYVSREAQDQLDPDMAGWFGDREQFAFDTRTFRPREDARRFELGTPSLPSVHAGRAGLEIVTEIGPERIRQRQTELTDELVDRLTDRGYTLATPEDPQHRAGIVMVDLDEPAEAVARLAAKDIVVDHRPGRLRISPYFYNTSEELQRIAKALDAVAPAG